jgi:hypothetical protein
VGRSNAQLVVRSTVWASLNVPFGHNGETLAGFVGFGLYLAPVGVIAEVQGTEMIDGLLNAIALANDENANGFNGERSGATVRSGNSHRFCFELSRWWLRKPKNQAAPR